MSFFKVSASALPFLQSLIVTNQVKSPLVSMAVARVISQYAPLPDKECGDYSAYFTQANAGLVAQYLDFVKDLNLFSHIQTLGKSSKSPAKDLNSDIKSLCDTALSKCLFILIEISMAKWSATRSNVIAKMVADNKS